MNSWTDDTLVQYFEKGNDDAFVILMNRHSASVKSYAFRMLHNEEQAEEICTETFFRIAMQRGKWENRGVSFKSYLFRIAHNLAIDIIRKNSLHRKKEGQVIQFSEILLQQQTPEESLEKKERAEMLHKALDALAAEEREIVMLRSTHGFSSKETAEILNLTPTQVDAKYAYARNKLKENLASLYNQKRKLS